MYCVFCYQQHQQETIPSVNIVFACHVKPLSILVAKKNGIKNIELKVISGANKSF